MSLLKIPCILIAMVGLQITTTAPHPPALPEETLVSTRMEGIIKWRSGPAAVKLICWGAAISEALVIFASRTSHWKISQGILSVLAMSGTEEKVQTSPLFFLGTLLTGLGGLLRYRCYRELGILFTFEMSIRKNHRLVTSGPYSIVRHPGYSGVILCIVGIVIWHAGSGSWARESGLLQSIVGQVAAVTYLVLVSLITTGLLGRMAKEDETLSETFGKEWADWVERVPYRLIPGLY